MSGLSEALLPVVHEYVLYSEMLWLSWKKRPDTGRNFDVQRQILICLRRLENCKIKWTVLIMPWKHIGKDGNKTCKMISSQHLQLKTCKMISRQHLQLWLRRTSSVVNSVLLHGNPLPITDRSPLGRSFWRDIVILIEDLYVIFGR